MDVRALVSCRTALWSLSLAISPENQGIVSQAGGVEPLIAQLSGTSDTLKEQAAGALSKLACDNEETRHEIATKGGVKLLLQILEAGTSNVAVPGDVSAATSADQATGAAAANNQAAASSAERRKSGRHKRNSSANTSTAATMSTEDGSTAGCPAPVATVAPPPAAALKTTQTAVLQNAASALAELSVEPAARDEIVAASGIDHLVRLLHGRGPGVKTFTAAALARLALDHEETQLVIGDAGAIPPLVALSDGREGSSAQEEAAGALFALAAHERNRLTIATSDGIGSLVNLLACDNSQARVHAEGALVRLSIENSNRALIIQKLVHMVHNTDASGQEQAAAALSNLARESEENRNSIVEANGIPPLLALLDSSSGKAKENCALAQQSNQHSPSAFHSVAPQSQGSASPSCIMFLLRPPPLGDQPSVRSPSCAASLRRTRPPWPTPAASQSSSRSFSTFRRGV